MNILTARNYSLFILCIAAISLSSAYFVEYIMYLVPCPLCIYQRVPYFVLVILSAISLYMRKNYYYLFMIVFLSSILLAAYHTGVERGIFELSSICQSKVEIADDTSVEDFRKMLGAKPSSSCDKPALVIFGLSMTEWNLLLNCFLFTITTYLFYIRRKNA